MATLTLIDGQGRPAAIAPSDRAAKTQEAGTVLAELDSLLPSDDALKQAVGLLALALKARRSWKGGE